LISRFPAGTVLWRAGETPSMVVAIETGHIKVYRTLPGGNVAALYLFGPGEFFGFLPFLDCRPYPATAETIDEVRARTMSRVGLLRALSENPAVALQLFAFLGRRLREAFDRIELLSARGALPRVAAALAALLQQSDYGTARIVSLPVPSGEFARALGIAPESFSRAVTDLAEAGVIHRLGRGRFQVLDPQSLRVSLKPAFFAAALDGPFVAQRKAGVLPQDIDPRITDPLVEKIAGLPEEQFLAVGPVVGHPFPAKKGIFEAKPCAKCGEIVFADKLRVQGGAEVCIPCSGYER